MFAYKSDCLIIINAAHYVFFYLFSFFTVLKPKWKLFSFYFKNNLKKPHITRDHYNNYHTHLSVFYDLRSLYIRLSLKSYMKCVTRAFFICQHCFLRAILTFQIVLFSFNFAIFVYFIESSFLNMYVQHTNLIENARAIKQKTTIPLR